MTAPDFSARIRRVLREQPIRLEGEAPNPALTSPHIADPEPVVAAFNKYLQLLDEWNARLDLSAARNHNELVDLFVADSYLLSKLVPKEPGGAWVDVGTGAGAPGIGLKILQPDLNMTLVEPLSKRISFLRTVLGTLSLSGITARKARSEALAPGEFATALSRATLKPAEWLSEGSRIAKDRVWVLLAQDVPPSCKGWHVHLDAHYSWPLTGVERRAICYTKTCMASPK